MTKAHRGYIDNPHLKTLKFPLGWQGTRTDDKGLFRNLHHPFIPIWLDVMRWKFFQKNPYKELKKSEGWNPVVMKDESWLTKDEDMIVWLGHCTFYIRINGIQLITDPVFGDIYPLKRKSEFPIHPHHLQGLDYVLLSHDHRDHLDKSSLKIVSKQNPDARYLTGLRMKKLIHAFTGSDQIEEAGWYQQYNTEQHPLQITFIPTRHWARRGLTDTNKRLWGGFVIEAAGKRIFFGGDSAYDEHYNEIATVFGHFDYALLGIGAYEPVWFMKSNHQSPAEALKAFQELNAGIFIPMHYGTFDLSDEPLSKPLQDLVATAEDLRIISKLKILTIGHPLLV